MGKVDYIVIHCSATRPSQDIGLKEIDSWHRKRGFAMVGYHMIIRRNGIVEHGRPLDMDHILEPNEVGAHVEGFNSRSVGVCLVGGVSEENVNIPENNFTIEQWNMLPQVILGLMGQFPEAKVVGHRELNPGKACPSFDVQAWLTGVHK